MVALITQSILNFRLGFELGHSVNSTNKATTSAIRSRLLPPPVSWIENEERRRLFWVVYSMDRYTTLGTHSRFAIDERTARRRLPCRYDLFSEDRFVETRWPRWDEFHGRVEEDTHQNAANLGSYSYHCELLKIMSQTHEFLEVPLDIQSQMDIDKWRSRYSELDQWLSTWLRSLPGEYSEISQFCHSVSISARFMFAFPSEIHRLQSFQETSSLLQGDRLPITDFHFRRTPKARSPTGSSSKPPS